MGKWGLVPGIPTLSDQHVLHGIASGETYVVGECVADLWCAATSLLELVPEPGESGAGLGYLGESFWRCRGTSGSRPAG